MTHSISSWRRSAALLTPLCIASAVLADWLFYDHPIGCSVAIFAVAMFVLLCVRDGSGGMARKLAGRILVLALVGLFFALADEPDLLRVMMTLAALVALAMISRAGWTHRVTDWAERIAWLIFLGPV